jgi:hypothetical protein
MLMRKKMMSIVFKIVLDVRVFTVEIRAEMSRAGPFNAAWKAMVKS